jgi:hypothetical protein
LGQTQSFENLGSTTFNRQEKPFQGAPRKGLWPGQEDAGELLLEGRRDLVGGLWARLFQLTVGQINDRMIHAGSVSAAGPTLLRRPFSFFAG